MPWSLDTCSTQLSPAHRVGMRGISYRDTHLDSLHTSSVHLTTTTYVRRSGRIINGTRSGRTTPQDSALQFQTPAHTHARNDPPKKSLGPAQPLPHLRQTFPLLFTQMRYGPFCSFWVWRRTNRRPCYPPRTNPSNSPWTARPDSSGWRNNRLTAQNLPRDLVRPSNGLNELAQTM